MSECKPLSGGRDAAPVKVQSGGWGCAMSLAASSNAETRFPKMRWITWRALVHSAMDDMAGNIGVISRGEHRCICG